MSIDNIEKDKNICFENIGCIAPYRNVMSYCMFGVSNTLLLIVSAYKVTHPLVGIGLCVLNSMAQFLKTSASTKKLLLPPDVRLDIIPPEPPIELDELPVRL